MLELGKKKNKAFLPDVIPALKQKAGQRTDLLVATFPQVRHKERTGEDRRQGKGEPATIRGGRQ